jgi:hypothetical protein
MILTSENCSLENISWSTSLTIFSILLKTQWIVSCIMRRHTSRLYRSWVKVCTLCSLSQHSESAVDVIQWETADNAFLHKAAIRNQKDLVKLSRSFEQARQLITLTVQLKSNLHAFNATELKKTLMILVQEILQGEHFLLLIKDYLSRHHWDNEITSV